MSALLRNLRWDLGGVTSSECDGDNLSILLVSHFDDLVESEEMDESGSWKREAVDKANTVLDAIHTYYVAAIEAERAARIEAEAALAEAREAAIVEGWDACRRSIYAVCEDIGDEADRNRADTDNPPRHHFGRGEGAAAKRIARAFNSMEARDDDNVRAALSRTTEREAGPS